MQQAQQEKILDGAPASAVANSCDSDDGMGIATGMIIRNREIPIRSTRSKNDLRVGAT